MFFLPLDGELLHPEGGAYIAGPKSPYGSPAARRRFSEHHALHIEFLGRRRTVISGLSGGGGPVRMAMGFYCERARTVSHDRRLSRYGARKADAGAAAVARFPAGRP